MRRDPDTFWLVASFFVAVMAGASAAKGHSWYPTECCSSSDCEMVTASKIARDDTAWLLPNGERVPFENARKSLDDDFHWCRYTNGPTDPIIKPTGKAPCLFVPEGGV